MPSQAKVKIALSIQVEYPYLQILHPCIWLSCPLLLLLPNTGNLADWANFGSKGGPC